MDAMTIGLFIGLGCKVVACALFAGAFAQQGRHIMATCAALYTGVLGALLGGLFMMAV